MQDLSKTKKELIEELNELRSRLEGSAGTGKAKHTGCIDIEHCHALLDNIIDLVYICDDKGNVLYLNNAFKKMSGHEPEGFIGTSFAPLFDGENLKKATDGYQRTLKGESPCFEVSFKDTGILCAYSNIPHRNKDGKIIGVLGTARDVTEERKIVETLINESEQKFRSIFESSSDALMLLDKRGFFDCNKATLRIFGCSDKKDFLGHHPGEWSPPLQPDGSDSRKAADEKISDAYRIGRNFFEWTHRRADGEEFPAEVLLTPVKLEGKEILQATVRDITERKKAEEALKNATKTYQSMFLNSMVGMSRTRLSDGKFLEINDRLVEMFGYDNNADFVANYSAVKCYAIEGERERALGIIKEFGELKNFETLAKRKDGSTFWIQFSGRVNKEEGYLDSVSLDIDDQRRAQEKLKKNERLLQNILDNTTAVIYVKDLDGKYLHSNTMHKKLFQKEHEDIINKDDYDIFPREMADAFRSNDQLVLKANAPVEFEEVAPHDDGEHAYISIKFPINDNEGKPYAVAGISTDITAIKRTSERIEAMNRCFLDFGTDSTQNILSLTHLLGTLMNGTCALYSRIEQEMLCTVGQCQAHADYKRIDKPDGHICYDVIRNNKDDIFYIGDLSQTKYAKTDINVINYNLKSYIGKAVTCNGAHVGSLCVVFTDDFTPSEEDKKYLEIIAVAIGIEEERKLAGEKLKRSRENSRNLSMHLQNMQEQERGRIARDIHDDLGQLLTALDFDLAFVTKRLREDQKELREKAGKMSELIRVSTETVQRIASELRPALLDNLGLMAAMEWQADEYSAHTGIACDINFDSSIEIRDKNLSTAFFRAFQEALTNAARHANPSKVSVEVKKNAKHLTLEISDDGKGIREEEVLSETSFGLSGIMERFYPFDGNVKIKGLKNKGTTISIEVPLGEVK